MIVRLLLTIAIVVVGWYLYRQWTRPATPGNGDGVAPGRAPMVNKCEECEVHVPASGGVHYQGHFFCTPQHLQDWLRRNGQP